MKSKDLFIWIHQPSPCKDPWAVRVHGMRRGSALSFDAEIYAEWAPGRNHRIDFHGGRWRVFPVPPEDDSGIGKCVLSDLPGALSDLAQLYGGEVSGEDLKAVRNRMQKLFKNL